MIRNYLVIALRKIFGNWIQSSINLFGLVVGIASSLLIFSYVSHEMQYDNFHKDSERIYKAGGTLSYGGNEFNLFGFSPGFGTILQASDNRIEVISRVKKAEKKEVTANGKTFFENEFYFVDDQFLNLFNFPLYSGSSAELIEPYRAFLTKEAAMKYFSTLDIIGKTLTFDQKTEFIVAGIIENPPSNSSIKFEFVASASTLGLLEESKEEWNNEKYQLGSFETFLKLDNPASKALVEETMMKLNEDPSARYQLHAIEDLHLRFGEQAENHASNLVIFIAIGIMILLLAVINYINLTIAQATSRFKEIGVRKVNGASRTALTAQFFLESGLYVIISFVLGALIAYLIQPGLYMFLGITVDKLFLVNPTLIMIMAAMILGLIILAGTYPSIVMGRRQSVNILKGNLDTRNKGGSLLQKSFSSFQFGVSVAMIFCTIVVGNQLEHLRAANLGLDKDQVLVLSSPGSAEEPLSYLKNQLSGLAGVEKVATSSFSMFKGGYSIYFVPIPERDDNGVSINYMTIDENFVDLLGVEWVQEPNRPLTNNDLILNQTAVERLNLPEDPRGKTLALGGKGTVAGVVANFKYSPLTREVGPMAMRLRDGTLNVPGSENNFLYLKIAKESNLEAILAQLEMKMNEYRTASPLEYYFLDDAFNDLYRSQERLGYLFGIFSLIAVAVACLGLLGLVTFALERRVKEIGIRKVIGASPFQLVSMFTLRYFWVFIISSALALPLAWIAMNNWLSQFANRITLQPLYALAPALGLIILGFLVIAIRSYVASSANVVESLRNE